MKYETNIFKIENLQKLSAEYALFEILGLNQYSGDDDYEINIQHIIRTLSYSLKHPVTIITKNEKPHLVVQNVQEVLNQVPAQYQIKRNNLVHFKKIGEAVPLDFVNYTEETREIIIRFLQFNIQAELNLDHRIWQPASGDAFFNKNASEIIGIVGIYNGFLFRVVELPDGNGFGLAIDVTKKYISETPERIKLSRADFKKLRLDKSHLVYNYGGKRYEVKVHQISDLNASQYKFPRRSDGTFVSLLEDTQESFKKASGTMPPEVANLPDDASVLMYMTNDKEERGVIAGLCHRVFDTEDSIVGSIHRKSILPPFHRRRLIHLVRSKFFNNLYYGNIRLQIGEDAFGVQKKKFIAPDVLFGNDVIVSVRGTAGAIQTTIEKLGRQRLDLLQDGNIGFHTTGPFEAQYFVVPQTLYNMFCNEQYFLKDLAEQVNQMHRSDGGWKPEVITYNNRGKKNSVDIGFEIVQQIKERIGKNKRGYAVVVLPSDVERIKHKHDETAALIVTECLENHDLQVGIMHSDTLQECFIHKTHNGQSKYVVKGEMQGKYNGYVRGVAINQVLLNNERWPFILQTPLNADLTISIDVKRQIAGFTFIDKYSKVIFTRPDKSDNREKLTTGQVVRMLTKWIPLQVKYADYKIRNIAIHRDGRLFPSERDGIEKAIVMLKQKNILPSDASITIVEIPKHSMAPYRLFDITGEYNILKTLDENNKTLNPEIGSWVILNSFQALICTTGREFKRNGSSNPLLVNFSSANMRFEEIIEDVYYLSTLAYTKPDDCSRLPLTMRLTDRKINNLGSEFDLESLEILKSEHY
jgi:hypothetical protein